LKLLSLDAAVDALPYLKLVERLALDADAEILQ
jgi:hypothetical protein